MRLLRKLEFASGLATLLLGAVVVAVAFDGNSYAAKPSENSEDFLQVALVWILFPAVVALGSYIHGIKRKKWGLYLLGVCGLIAFGLISILFYVILLSWYYPIGLAFLTLAPPFMAFLTFILALVASDK
jgi:hypothetical protein